MANKKCNLVLEESTTFEMPSQKNQIGEVIATQKMPIIDYVYMVFKSYKKMDGISITERIKINYDDMLKNDSQKYHTWLTEEFIYEHNGSLGNYMTPMKELLKLKLKDSIHEWIKLWCIELDGTNSYEVSKENLDDLTKALLKEEFNIPNSFEICCSLSNILNNLDFNNYVLVYEVSL